MFEIKPLQYLVLAILAVGLVTGGCSGRKNLKPEDITAFEITGGTIEPYISMTQGKRYEVISWEPYNKQNVALKESRTRTRRFAIFVIQDDSGSQFQLALDLDDPDVEFHTE